MLCTVVFLHFLFIFAIFGRILNFCGGFWFEKNYFGTEAGANKLVSARKPEPEIWNQYFGFWIFFGKVFGVLGGFGLICG